MVTNCRFLVHMVSTQKLATSLVLSLLKFILVRHYASFKLILSDCNFDMRGK
jgi:hypothetical protein